MVDTLKTYRSWSRSACQQPRPRPTPPTDMGRAPPGRNDLDTLEAILAEHFAELRTSDYAGAQGAGHEDAVRTVIHIQHNTDPARLGSVRQPSG